MEGKLPPAHNLQTWLSAKGFHGVDAVAHSHGGNVVMQATSLGAAFGHVLLLNWPVRPSYAFRDGSAITVRSVRTCFDIVILADRGGQRFPPRSRDRRALSAFLVRALWHDRPESLVPARHPRLNARQRIIFGCASHI
jgi:hypothetical protein